MSGGKLIEAFPSLDSPLRADRFFPTLYGRYDDRFVFAAPIFATRNVTPRIEWHESSPIFNKDLTTDHDHPPVVDYHPRIASST